MNTCYLAFYKGKDTFFNKFISWWTVGLYSHVEIVIDNKMYSSSFIDGGVRSSNIVDFSDGKWDIVCLSDIDIDYVLQWFKNNEGKKYDLMGILGFIFRPIENDKSKYFCSESVAASLGYNESWRLDPNTLYAILTSKK